MLIYDKYPPTSIFYFTFLSKQSKSLISFYMAFHLVDIEGKVDEPADCGSNCPEEILHDGCHWKNRRVGLARSCVL